ncbi:MAG: TerB family tellurite resistance protein [Pseudomonadales bacterium]
MLSKLAELFRRQKTATTEDAVIDAPVAAAALMLEVTWADHTIDDQEIATSTELLQQLFELPAATARQLVEDAQERLQDSTGVQHYTRFLNETLSEPEKFAVVTALWRVALASDGLDRFEEHTIRRVADLLYLSHNRFIEAKLIAKAN